MLTQIIDDSSKQSANIIEPTTPKSNSSKDFHNTKPVLENQSLDLRVPARI